MIKMCVRNGRRERPLLVFDFLYSIMYIIIVVSYRVRLYDITLMMKPEQSIHQKDMSVDGVSVGVMR